jgi:hypothetical protein
VKPVLVAAALFLASTVAVDGQQPSKAAEEPLAEQVRQAIDRGVSYLRGRQDRSGGHWELISADNQAGLIPPGGQSALALLALLNAGLDVDDPVIVSGLRYLRKLERPITYVRALQTMVFAQAGHSADVEHIDKNVKHFIRIATRDNDGRLIGWGYDRGSGSIAPDNSNTQYVLLALGAARQAKVEIPAAFWEEIRAYYARTQNEDGSWNYRTDGDGGMRSRGPALTMTVAGLCGVLMCQMELDVGREKLNPREICGLYEENKPFLKGLAWINKPPPETVDHFRIEDQVSTFYNIYGIERLGRLSGMRFIGPHDWYREGCRWLVDNQNKATGGWNRGSAYDSYPIVSTSFAVLFLSKGRMPILISKLAHGMEPRQNNDQDWNRRRNDLRHLVDFASETVFAKKPMGWQTFDILRAVQPHDRGGRVGDDEVTSNLLQSPIAYITGHESPELRLRLQRERDILKKYVENGGFILAVACCGSKAFDAGFRTLCQSLFPDNELTRLPPDHPVYSMRFQVKPGSFDLEGIQFGCKTVLIYCPHDLCGYWEINRRNDSDMGTDAFRLGANIIAYATGLEAPKPRLTEMAVNAPAKDGPLASAPRGYFQAGQLIGRVGDEADWQPAPAAMSRLMQSLREKAGLDVVLKTANVPIDHRDLADFKFLYMHGRKDFKFSMQKLERLRFNLRNGGLLLADACCGHTDFDKAFRRFIGDLFPPETFPAGEAPRLVAIPANDDLFSKDLNGEALTDANIKCRLQPGAAPKSIRPALEGVKIGKRWAVIYSKYDIGCALEKHQGADCVGYTHDSALRIGQAAVLYQFFLEGSRAPAK